VPEIKRGVSVVPAEFFKTKRRHLMVINDVAWAIVQRRRGVDSKFVFTYHQGWIATLQYFKCIASSTRGSLNLVLPGAALEPLIQTVGSA